MICAMPPNIGNDSCPCIPNIGTLIRRSRSVGVVSGNPICIIGTVASRRRKFRLLGIVVGGKPTTMFECAGVDNVSQPARKSKLGHVEEGLVEDARRHPR